MLFEHVSIALTSLAAPLPQGFTPFFAYLGYKVLKYNQFLWHVRSGTFDLQIDLVKLIMAGTQLFFFFFFFFKLKKLFEVEIIFSNLDMKDSDDEENISKKLQLISLLPKSRGSRVLNGWSHSAAVSLRARQHASDLLSGVTSLARKSTFRTMQSSMLKNRGTVHTSPSPLDTFFTLLTAKANPSDIDLGLLTEATLLSMQLG